MSRIADSHWGVPGDFRTTHWNVVLAAGRSDSPEKTAALTALCETYWYPLFAFVRRQGRNGEQAEDLTQEFFVRLLRKNALASVQPEHGRFRSFLLASLRNFLANDWDRTHRAKRGVPIPSFHGTGCAGRSVTSASHRMTRTPKNSSSGVGR